MGIVEAKLFNEVTVKKAFNVSFFSFNSTDVRLAERATVDRFGRDLQRPE